MQDIFYFPPTISLYDNIGIKISFFQCSFPHILLDNMILMIKLILNSLENTDYFVDFYIDQTITILRANFHCKKVIGEMTIL